MDHLGTVKAPTRALTVPRE